MPPVVIRVEINANMDCSAACPRCDRGVAELPDRKEHMTVQQIKDFVDELRRRKDEVHVGRAKVVGGEFLIHPNFLEIFNLLGAACDEGLIDYIKISTNCVQPIPSEAKHPKISWVKSPLKKKQHLPMVWHPADLGLPAHGFCSHPRVCGMSLSMKGWLPCSPAMLIAGCFDQEHLYKQEIPTEPWGVELCDSCAYALPKKFRQENLTFTHAEPTPRWKAGLENYAKKNGYALKMPNGDKAPPKPGVISLEVV